MPADFDPMETQSGPLNDQWSKKYRGLLYPKPKRSLTMKTLTLALALTALTVNLADAAGQRCRTSKMGSTTYTTCENPEKRCRSHRMGSTTYTNCDR